MSDSISRQAAIDQLHQSYNLLDAERRLEDMPSAQPERKKGRWVRHPEVKNVYGGTYIECSECHTRYLVMRIEEEIFCRCCGSCNAEEGGK